MSVRWATHLPLFEVVRSRRRFRKFVTEYPAARSDAEHLFEAWARIHLLMWLLRIVLLPVAAPVALLAVGLECVALYLDRAGRVISAPARMADEARIEVINDYNVMTAKHRPRSGFKRYQPAVADEVRS
jgi:hypothetical protein